MTITGFQAKLGKGKPSRLNYKFIRGQCSRRIVRRESQAPQTTARVGDSLGQLPIESRRPPEKRVQDTILHYKMYKANKFR